MTVTDLPLLRPHQHEAVKAVLTELKHVDRAQVTMPCGTGKSLVAVQCAMRSGAQVVLLVVPTLALVQQSARLWRAAAPQARLVIAGSENVEAAGGLPASTDPEDLAHMLGRPCPEMTVILSTYASLPRVAEAVRRARTVIDLAIGDEAHHCAGPLSAPSSLLARPGGWFPIRKRLFLTATRRIDADGNPQRVASMDDEAAFGRQVYLLTLRSAIERGLLSDYQIAIIAVTAQEWNWLAGAHAPVRVLGRRAAPHVSFGSASGFTNLSPQALAAVFALGRHMSSSRTRRVLTFHNRISEARSFAKAIPLLLARERGAPACLTHVVHGDLSARERATAIAALGQAQEQRGVVLSNVKCLAEGVDLPSLDAVVFAGTRTSTVDIMQAVGRVLRVHPGKGVGTVILPVLIRDGTEGVDRLASSSYADAFRVLSVLRDHDAELAGVLDTARRRAKRRRRAGRVLPLDVGPLRMVLPAGLDESFVRGFELEVLRGTTSSWLERFGALESWVERHGSAQVPIGTVVDGWRLGAWVHQQRTLYKQRCLSVARVRELEALPGWSWSSWDASWHRAFAFVRRHAERTGGAPIPQSAQMEGVKVGQWVKAQRERYHRGQLDEERARLLESVPGWVWRTRPPIRRQVSA